MAWARIDDVFPECKKILDRPDANLRVEASVALILTALQIRAICYCNRNLTDGVLPAGAVPSILVGLDPKGWPERMVEAGLWEPRDDGYSYIVHDFLDYNPSRKFALAAKDRNRLKLLPDIRKRVKRRDGGLCRYCGRRVNWSDRRGESGATYDHVQPGCGNGAENVVTSCKKCNYSKGHRSPQEADMTLLSPRESGSRSEPRIVTVLPELVPHPHPIKDQGQDLPPIDTPPTPTGGKAGTDPASREDEPRKKSSVDAPDSREGGAPPGASPPRGGLQEPRSKPGRGKGPTSKAEAGACEDCGRVVSLLNELSGRKFGRESAALLNLHARHREFGVEACERVVRVMVLSWLGTEWEEFLAPTTLFRPTKFERYLNKRPPAAPPDRTFDRNSPTDVAELNRRMEMLARISPDRRAACLSYLRHSIAEVEKDLDKATARSQGPAYLSMGASVDVDRLSSRLEELRAEVKFLDAGKEYA